MNLEGKTAIVTGASGGIGREIALELARQKARVVAHYCRSEEKAQSLVREIGALGGEAVALPARMEDEAEVALLFRNAVEMFGKFEILVCNAASTIDKPLLRLKTDEFESVIRTNLIGTFLCLREAGRHMLRNKYGRVVVVSSVVALTGNIGQAAYSASKAGIIALTKTFAREFARWDITANILAPGLVENGMSEKIPEEIKQKIISLIPKGRPATSAEVASLAAFLASDASRYITGQVHCVDGGMTML